MCLAACVERVLFLGLEQYVPACGLRVNGRGLGSFDVFLKGLVRWLGGGVEGCRLVSYDPSGPPGLVMNDDVLKVRLSIC